jgi:phosphoglucomutase/phosphomannomutase
LLSSESWESLSQKLLPEFTKLSQDEEVVKNALRLLQLWLQDPLYESQELAILAHIEAEKYSLLLDSFYQLVPFGTGGRRGRLGFGPNRINSLTVSLSVQGHCDYLRKQTAVSDGSPIVVAFDTRIFRDISSTYDFIGKHNPLLNLTSRALAYEACEIYAGNGFVVRIPEPQSKTAYLSTPELSFAIRYLRALGGINVSASHNHPDDNGFKFYNAEGAQDIPPRDEELAAFMNDVHKIRRTPFQVALKQATVLSLEPSVHEAYISANLSLRTKTPTPLIPIVYTPLSGTGDSTVGDVLRAAGYAVHLYKPQANYDGTFANVPFRLPNPEVPEAARPAIQLAEEQGACIVFSTDPDADRLGVYALTREGGWRYFSGNDIAAVLTYYLTLDREHGPERSGLIIKTLVTTRVLEDIARRSGCQIIPDLLVGFKYIANVLHSLEQSGSYNGIKASPQDMIIAAEESHGVLLTPSIRDKDSAGGALLLSELVTQLCHVGQYLPDYLDATLVECGNYANATRSIVMRGIEGTASLKEMMHSLRTAAPERIGDLKVLSKLDYLSEEFGPLKSSTDALSRNLLLFRLEGTQVVIRPSGTEPKVKVYADIEGQRLVAAGDRAAAESMARHLVDDLFNLCLSRIGVTLSPSASILPDHVDLDLRLEFDQRFRGDFLNEAKRLANSTAESTLQWFRLRLAPYGAGADPLEATRPALLHLCKSLGASASDPQIQQALREIQERLVAAKTETGN